LDDLPGDERLVLHRQIAEAIEAVYPDDETYAAVLVDHWRAVGDVDKEAHYARIAGEQALHSGANAQAANYLQRALELLQAQPETNARIQREFALQITLGAALMATEGWAALEVQQVYARAQELAPQVGEEAQLFSALWGLWAIHLLRAERETIRALSLQLMDLAQKAQDPDLLLEAWLALGVSAHILGEPAPALNHYEQVLAIYDVEQHNTHTFRYGQDPAVVALSLGANDLWFLGYPGQAQAWLDEAHALAQELDHPFNKVYVLMEQSKIAQFRRDVKAAQEWAEQLISIATEHEFTFRLGGGLIAYGWALARQGQSEGAEQFHQGLAIFQSTGARHPYAHYLYWLAEIYSTTGRIDEALRTVDEGLSLVHTASFHEADLHRLKGELLLIASQANQSEAESCFRRAIDVARRQQAKSWELRATVSLCRLWQRQGKVAEARDMLADIYSWFTEGFDTVDLQDAKALLDKLSS
jgi:predicted ATPase